MGEPLPATLSLAFSHLSNVFLISIVLSSASLQGKRPPSLMLMTLMDQELHWDVEPDLHMTAIKRRIYCLGTIRGFNNADDIYQSHNEENMSFASSEKHICQCCEQDCVNTAVPRALKQHFNLLNIGSVGRHAHASTIFPLLL